MAGNAVIHKQIIDLETVRLLSPLTGEEVLTFEVPIDAEMVDIQWDTKNPTGIAFWYKLFVPVEGARPRDTKNWKFLVAGTGHAFPECCTHLASVVRDGYAWHILDYDGGNITWAQL